MNLLESSYFGVPVVSWLMATGVAVSVIVILRLVQGVVTRRLAHIAGRTETRLDDLLLGLVKRTRVLFLVILGAYAGAYVIAATPEIRVLVDSVMVIALLVQAAIWGSYFVAGWIEQQAKRRMEEDAASGTKLSVLGTPAKFAVWAIAVLLALDNLGIDVTALIAGLGIGGIAVALAIQNILGDLFASLSIVLDRPFVVGDFIVVGDQMGTVERIGLKTTRVRSLSGEVIIFANNDLLKSRVRNYKQMMERRVVFGFGIVYQTPVAQVEAIPGMVREIIEAQPQTRLDRVHFKALGDSSLDFEAVFYMMVPDYAVYMDTQQTINIELMRRFEENGIEFAYPTQTLFIEGGDAKPASGAS